MEYCLLTFNMIHSTVLHLRMNERSGPDVEVGGAGAAPLMSGGPKYSPIRCHVTMTRDCESSIGLEVTPSRDAP